MVVSDVGRALIEQREGLRLQAYQDITGVWTIGYGHTSAAGPPKVTPRMKISRAQADAVLAKDLGKYEGYVSRYLKRTPTQNQFDAMVSLCYNIGPNGFWGSSVLKQFNLGHIQTAADDFLLWDKPAALKKRRQSERIQFLRG